ncbi:hypothetical protein llap_6255 [Limosa lapponica baueri]|uniref:Uncharacterized protein n=1 Tax=Limosa lapponica baueri TaxID=1758121 RepID=A0A2I0UBK2_LIMLA|nr:hypothetical protein llap_6255 [Limosa lapponica baueri]
MSPDQLGFWGGKICDISVSSEVDGITHLKEVRASFRTMWMMKEEGPSARNLEGEDFGLWHLCDRTPSLRTGDMYMYILTQMKENRSGEQPAECNQFSTFLAPFLTNCNLFWISDKIAPGICLLKIAQEMPLSSSRFLIAIVYIPLEELEIKHRMREALEISYVYRDLARALIDAKENCKKKENNQNEGNSQYEYRKRASLEMEIQHTWN